MDTALDVLLVDADQDPHEIAQTLMRNLTLLGGEIGRKLIEKEVAWAARWNRHIPMMRPMTTRRQDRNYALAT